MTSRAVRRAATLAGVDGFERATARAEDVCASLRRCGYAVVDDAVDADVARALAGEMRALANARPREPRAAVVRVNAAAVLKRLEGRFRVAASLEHARPVVEQIEIDLERFRPRLRPDDKGFLLVVQQRIQHANGEVI